MRFSAYARHAAAAALLVTVFAGSAAHAAEGPGWGPGHGMMWGGPARSWFGWRPGEHFCGEEGGRNVERFMALIERTVRPTDEQKPAEFALKDALDKSLTELAPVCEQAHSGRWSPLERLDAAEGHLNAMIKAIHVIRPALEAFYATLSDEQKTKFDAMRPSWKLHLPWTKDKQ